MATDSIQSDNDPEEDDPSGLTEQEQEDEDVLAGQAQQLINVVTSLNGKMNTSNDAIALSNERIAESNQRIAELNSYSHRSRRMICLLALSVVFDVFLSIGLGLVTYKAIDASHEAKLATKAACLSTNEARAQSVKLWTDLIGLNTAPTPAQAAQYAKLLGLVKTTYAPRDCNNL